MQIAGAIVHARPEKVPALRARLARTPGVEVHAAAPDGRLVVTLQDAGAASTGDRLHELARLKGVLSVSLVYHYDDTPLAAEEERR